MSSARLICCSLLTLLACLPLALRAAEPVDFAKEIAPLLQERCIRCHSSNHKKGDLSLESAAELLEKGYLIAGKPEESYLLDMLMPGENGQRPEMPKEGAPLSDAELKLIQRWIAEGAQWPQQALVKQRSKADGSWWSLQPLSRPAPPDPAGLPAGWESNPIDRFLFAELAAKGLSPNRPADRRTLIRRATYDLTGLPPAPEEIAAFLADAAPEAYERLLDRLLASPRYGEHWGRHWLDVIRFGESRGFERNQIIDNLWPFRDYVIRSFNDDKPFDQLIREHLAGDVIGKDCPDVEVGAAFLVSGPYDDVNNQDPVQAAQIRANTIDEIICASSEAFLGLTVGCAKCHDHKFDPILQRDYYGLYAVFAGVVHGEREVATAQQRQVRAAQLQPLQQRKEELTKARDDLQAAVLKRADERIAAHEAGWTREAARRSGTEETFAPVTARMVKLVVEGAENKPESRGGYYIDEFEVWTADEAPRNVALSSAGGKAEGRSRTAEDFADAYLPGLAIDGKFDARWLAVGPELTITLAQPERINRILFSSDRPNAVPTNGVASFVSEYRILVSDDGQNWTEAANSFNRRPMNDAHRRHRLLNGEQTADERTQLGSLNKQLASVDADIAKIPTLPVWWVGKFEKGDGPFHVFLGGSPQRKGDAVAAASLSGLAQAARPIELPVDANEGARRQAFADWLVQADNPLPARVLANRLWHYHFGAGLVDTPSDFGYMGGRPSHPALLDWLAARLQAGGWKLKGLHKEIMLSQAYRQSGDFRDAAAQIDADDRLLWRFPPRRLSAEEVRDTVLAVCGRLNLTPGGPGFRMYKYMQDNVATYVPLDRHGPDTFRRAVYHQNARAARVDLMTEFDSPDCAFSTPRRAETTTPLQALTMMNHQFTLEMAAALAQRLEQEAPGDGDERIRRGFELCFGRPASAQELDECRALVQTHGLPALCRVLLNTSELIYVK